MDKETTGSLRADLRKGGGYAAHAALVVSAWLGGRLQDVTLWAVNLVRDLPVRTGRLILVLWQGVRGLALALPTAFRAAQAQAEAGLGAWLRRIPRNVGIWLIVLLFRVLDLVGVPELLSLLVRLASHVTPLTGGEIGVAASILGPTAIRFADVRVAEGGVLNLIFARNGGRAFTTFHTLNLPLIGHHSRANFAILLHELVHVYQYERTGGLYIAEAIYAQQTTGYDYGGPEDLQQCLATGVCYRNFNREQQAQLVQDYYERRTAGLPVAAYEPFIAEMREGRL